MHNNLTYEIRLARLVFWWQRNDGYVYVVLFCLCSGIAGAFSMALYDKAERIELMRAHSEEITRLRVSFRATVDARDDKVRQSADAAAGAATAASTAAEALATVIEARPMPAPVARSSQPPNIGAAVREANRRAEVGQ